MLRKNANFNLVEQSARRVGRRLLREFAEVQHLQSSVKGPEGFARRAALEAETRLLEELMETRPNYGYRTARVGSADGKDPTRYWILDALDGFGNFSRGLPHWAITAALLHKGQPVLAVIFDPLANEMFGAEPGGGCWINMLRTRVSSRGRLAEALVAAAPDLEGQEGESPDAGLIDRLLRRTAGVRIPDAPLLTMAHVACARIDAFWMSSRGDADVPAGSLIVTESGGRIDEIADSATGRRGLIAAGSQIRERFAAEVGVPIASSAE